MKWVTDKSTAHKLLQVHPELAFRWTLVADEMFRMEGKQIKVVEGLRPFEMQLEYYKKGRTLINGVWTVTDRSKIITNSRPGEGLHCYGLAIDTAFLGKDPYLQDIPRFESERIWNVFGRMVNKHGMTWGGTWNKSEVPIDRTHCEMKFGLSTSQIQMIFEKKVIEGVFDACTLSLNKTLPKEKV